MKIQLSDEAKQALTAQNFTQDDINEIEKNATSSPNAELVAQEAFVLKGNKFITARIIDFACSPAPIEVLAKTIHDLEKFLRAGLKRSQITEIATHARHDGDIANILKLAQTAMDSETRFDNDELEQALALLRPSKPTHAAEASASTRNPKTATLSV
jgi:hypothetical protein